MKILLCIALLIGCLSSAHAAETTTRADTPSVSPWEIIVTSTFPSGVAMVGETGSYTLSVSNRTDHEESGTLRLTGQAPGEDITVSEDWSVRLGPDETKDYVWTPSTTASLYLALNATVTADGNSLAKTTSAILVVPQPATPPLPPEKSFFGTMILRDPQASSRIGIRIDRASIGWSEIQTRSGTYNWTDVDQKMALRASGGVGSILSILATNHSGSGPKGVAWNSAEELVDDKYLPDFVAFVRAVVERYKDTAIAVEILNEPNLVCDIKSKGIIAPSRIYARLLKAGYEASKSVAPDLPVIGMSVSGGDIPGFNFSQKAIDEAPGCMDIFGGHPYTASRYIGGDARPLSPLKANLLGDLNSIVAFMRKNGLPPHVWPTELGYALHWDEPLTTESARLFAAYTAQAIVLCRSVPEVEKLFWFASSFPANERFSSYGLFRSADEKINYLTGVGIWYPSPSAPAHATCARLLDDVTFVDRFTLGTLVQGVHFTDQHNGNDVFVLWVDEPNSTAGGAKLLLPDSAPRLISVDDALGRSLDPAAPLELEPLPRFLVVPSAQAVSLRQALDHAIIEPLEALKLGQAAVIRKDLITVDVINNDLRAVPVKVYQRGQASTARSRKIEPGVTQLTIPATLSEETHVRTEIVLLGERTSVERRAELNYYLHTLPKVASVDTLAGRTAPIKLDLRDQVLPADPGTDWSGPDDLSINAAAGWTDAGVALLIKVTDDIHVGPPAGTANLFRFDSVQIAFDMGNRASFGYDANCREFSIALDQHGQTKVYEGARARPADGITVTREGTATIYRVLIPWSWLGDSKPALESAFRMNFIANDNDGKGRACWIGLTPGIGESKLPNAYHQWLVEPAGK